MSFQPSNEAQFVKEKLHQIIMTANEDNIDQTVEFLYTLLTEVGVTV